MSARCKTCGEEIIWIITSAGRRMPLSVASQERRFVITPGTADERGRNPTAQQIDTYLSHFADCPDAAEHRRKR